MNAHVHDDVDKSDDGGDAGTEDAGNGGDAAAARG